MALTSTKKKVKTVLLGDPIGDMLARIRNANERYHPEVSMPASRLKEEIARILKEEGFIQDYRVEQEGVKRILTLQLKYKGKRGKERVIQGLKRVSKPSRRVYVGADEIPRVRGGLGIAILSTSQGVMTGQDAQRRRIGGEVLCYVW
jgi:small subunit ribosomal protein S8